MLESYVKKTRDKAAALTFMGNVLKRHGSPAAFLPKAGMALHLGFRREIIGVSDCTGEKVRRSNPGLLAVSLLLAAPLCRAAEPAVTTIQLDLTPVPANAGSNPGGIRVTESITSTIAPTVLRLDSLAPYLDRSRDKVTGLTARDDAGALALAGPTLGEGGDALLWIPQRPARGSIKLSYVMPAALPHPVKRGPHVDLQAVDDGIAGAFSGFLLAPEGTLHATVRWHLLAKQRVVSSLGDGDVDVTLPDEKLRRAFFVAGTLHTIPGELPAKGFGVAVLGHGVTMEPIATWSTKVYGTERQAFHDPDDSRYRVLIRSYDGGPFSSGRAAPNGFLFYLPQGQKLDSLSHRQTLAHEFVHSLSSSLDDERGNQGLWYTEGSADYFSIMIPFRAKLFGPNEYLTLVNNLAATYYTNPLRTTTNASLDQLMWSGRIAWTVPYNRGFMYFVDLGEKLQRRRTGLTVLDLVNATTAAIRSGSPQTNATWEAILKQRVGAWAVSDWKVMLSGRLIVPASNAFGPCFERQELNTGLFDLGFAKPVAVHEGEVISGVDPAGPAARAGMQDGDVIVHTVDLNGPSGFYDQSLTIQVRRNGRTIDITYDPHAGSVPAYRWVGKAARGICRAAQAI